MEGQTPAPTEETEPKNHGEELKVKFGETTVFGEDNIEKSSAVANEEGSANNNNNNDNDENEDDNDDEEPKYINHDVCDCCNEAGNLICCDSCPTSLHFDCSDPPVIIAPEGKWFCPKSDHTLHQRRRGGRHLRDVECCELQSGESVQCKACSRRYHLKCLEPPLLVQPAYFECENHLRDDERFNSEPAHAAPAAFTDSLLQSKVKVDFDLPPFIEKSMLGDEINTPNISKLKEILLNEVNGEEANHFLESVVLPPPLSSADGEKGYLKYVFSSQFEEEEMLKDWSSNVILFKQFHEWLNMLRTAKAWKQLLTKIASTPEGIKKLNELRPYTHECEEPAKKKPAFVPEDSSFEDNEKYIKVLMSKDLDSIEMQRSYKGHILFAAKFRKAVEEFKKSGSFGSFDMFPSVKKFLSSAPDANSVSGPRIALSGKVIAAFKTSVVIGRGKSKTIGLNLGKLLGETAVLAMSHTHAVISCNKSTGEFVIAVSGMNGLFVDEVYVPQGEKAVLKNGSKITIFFIDYYFYDK